MARRYLKTVSLPSNKGARHGSQPEIRDAPQRPADHPDMKTSPRSSILTAMLGRPRWLRLRLLSVAGSWIGPAAAIRAVVRSRRVLQRIFEQGRSSRCSDRTHGAAPPVRTAPCDYGCVELLKQPVDVRGGLIDEDRVNGNDGAVITGRPAANVRSGGLPRTSGRAADTAGGNAGCSNARACSAGG